METRMNTIKHPPVEEDGFIVPERTAKAMGELFTLLADQCRAPDEARSILDEALNGSVFTVLERIRSETPKAKSTSNGFVNPYAPTLNEENFTQFLKLNDNLRALGREPVDLTTLFNDALEKELKVLLSKNVHPHETQDYLDPHHLCNPQVGDTWSERMYCHYLTVARVNSINDMIVCTYTDLAKKPKGAYRINRAWLARFVLYSSSKLDHEKALTSRDFCASVTTGYAKHLTQAQEWYSQLDKSSIVDLRSEEPV